MLKVLLVCDKSGWAYDAICKVLIYYSPEDIIFDIFYVKGDQDLESRSKQYDKIFFIGWSLLLEQRKPILKIFSKSIQFSEYKLVKRYKSIPDGKILVGIHAHHDWDDGRTFPDIDVLPPSNLVNALKTFAGVNTVSTKLYQIFKKAGLSNLSCTLNGVDVDIFRVKNDLSLSDKLCVGYAGTRKRDWKERVSDFIDPLSNVDFVELKLATPQDNFISHDKMPNFYNDIDVYLCASNSEGFSLSVLEAAACGRVVVSTRVGGSVEMIKDNVNGRLVDQDLSKIEVVLKELQENRQQLREFGSRMRKDVEEKWDWKIRVSDWYAFVKMR